MERIYYNFRLWCGDAEFDINQKYRFAIVCSSSKEGDKFWGAPESKLWVDDIEVIYKK